MSDWRTRAQSLRDSGHADGLARLIVEQMPRWRRQAWIGAVLERLPPIPPLVEEQAELVAMCQSPPNLRNADNLFHEIRTKTLRAERAGATNGRYYTLENGAKVLANEDGGLFDDDVSFWFAVSVIEEMPDFSPETTEAAWAALLSAPS